MDPINVYEDFFWPWVLPKLGPLATSLVLVLLQSLLVRYVFQVCARIRESRCDICSDFFAFSTSKIDRNRYGLRLELCRRMLPAGSHTSFPISAPSNRRWFHNVEFFFFLFNALFGLVTFFKRFLWTIFYTLIYVSRLDLTTMPNGRELTDPGYAAYIGALLIDHYYSNACMITFVRLGGNERAMSGLRITPYFPIFYQAAD